jgi:hypothetical protein
MMTMIDLGTVSEETRGVEVENKAEDLETCEPGEYITRTPTTCPL